jgi:hypothetical protein
MSSDDRVHYVIEYRWWFYVKIDGTHPSVILASKPMALPAGWESVCEAQVTRQAAEVICDRLESLNWALRILLREGSDEA